VGTSPRGTGSRGGHCPCQHGAIASRRSWRTAWVRLACTPGPGFVGRNEVSLAEQALNCWAPCHRSPGRAMRGPAWAEVEDRPEVGDEDMGFAPRPAGDAAGRKKVLTMNHSPLWGSRVQLRC
jgi:hypothetical protein